MNSQEYWRRRVLYAKQKELDAVDDYEDAMRSRLKDLQNEINKEASVFVNRYAETNEISKEAATKILSSIDSTKWSMTLEEFKAKAKAGGYEKELDSEYFKSRIARLQSLHDQLADFASKYADSETDKMAVALVKRYNDTYLLENYNKYLVVGGLDIDLAHFNEQQLKDIVYQPWRGSDFSKRIWENYTKVMPDVLTDVLLRSTLMGYSWQRTQRMLEDRFAGIEQKQLHRLVITEMGHAAEQATAKFYEDSKIEQYEYLATLESHTCDVCAHLDERIFYVKDKVVGLNYPLIHPYCRCTTMPYMKDLPDITSRWSRDPITGKSKFVRNQPYSQWARKNGQKLLSFTEWKKIEGIKPLQLGMLKALPVSKLSKGEERAIKQYVSSESYKVNYALRNNEPLTKEQQTMVNNLDKALKKMPRYTDKAPLQRDYFFSDLEIQNEFVHEMYEESFEDPAYISTSKIHYGEGTEQVHVIIKNSKSGRDITQFNEEEQEVLFPRNTRFYITKSYMKDGVITFEWEER